MLTSACGRIQPGRREVQREVIKLQKTQNHYEGDTFICCGLTIENAVIDAMKLANATANGVRCDIRRSGITGYGAHRASTYTNDTPKIILTVSSPHISGCDHGNSSVVLILKADNMHATETTNVKEPRKSMRLSFEYVPSLATRSGNLMLTLSATRTNETSSNGACPRKVDQRLSPAIQRGDDHLREESCAPDVKISRATMLQTSIDLPSPSIIYPSSDGTAEAGSKAEQANAIFGGLILDRRTV